jgi:hypothetical protein
MKTSESINELAKALANAQGQMKPAIKDSSNPYFKSKYANIASIWEAIRESLYKNEICVLQDAITTEDGVAVYTRVIHSSGQWIEYGPFEVVLQKKDAHSLGSATSYAKRYSLSAALGIVAEEEDDDGNTAKNAIVDYISAEQLHTIETLINGHEDIRQRMLKAFVALKNIPLDNYDNVINTVNRLITDKRGV